MKNISQFLILIVLWSCGDKANKTEQVVSIETPEHTPAVTDKTPEYRQMEFDTDYDSSVVFIPGKGINPEALKNEIDLNMDISELSISDLVLLRNSFAAKQGYCFMKADLRAIFNTTTWYEKRMNDRYWAEEDINPFQPITYSKEELQFIEKIKNRENELKTRNLVAKNGRIVPNLNNIINLFQLEEADPRLMKMLGQNGFAVVPNDHIQLFHVYEQNDYRQFPNFVTTDMYMQLFHMYFGYLLRTVEEEKFIPLLSTICQNMYTDMMDVAKSNPDPTIQELAKHNATYYAIGFVLLTNKKIEIPSGFEAAYNQELKNIKAIKDDFSEFLDYKDVYFPYSLFKPRGHYTRNDELKRYFQAMMWLQTSPFCLDNDLHLKRAILNAWILNKSPRFGKETINSYRQILEPINFIIGLPDNVSFLQLAEVIQNNNYDLNSLFSNANNYNNFKREIKKIADAQNLIKPKVPMSCVDKINFMPQRYLHDNEVLQELVDVKNTPTQRGFPKGLDVMAAFGSTKAEKLLIDELKEGENWKPYPDLLSKLKTQMKDIDWDASVYNKWIESLLVLQQDNKDYPYFMQTPQWDKKNLNAALASWAELKHDAILYAEQPMAAECGGGGPPDPYTLGYVEPNIAYWKKVIELLSLTESVLKGNQLWDENIERITKRLKENAQFLLSASEKELSGKKLSEKEYREIEVIGSTFEWITLDLVKRKDEYLDSWDNVSGPDKSVAIVADIYTSNAMNNPNKGILHVATGFVNDLYVLVEIEGYLYLTKGAVLSYHEFVKPLNERLTDEEWQKMLDDGQAPDVPEWMKEIIVPINPPKMNEKIFYSSGC